MFHGFLNVNSAGLIVVVAAIAYFVWRDRDNIEWHGIMVMRRSKRGLNFLDRTAKRFPRLWRWWSTAGGILAIGIMAATFFFFLVQALKVFMVAEAVPAVGLVLPTTSTQASFSPGVFLVPFWYWIIGIGTVAIVHEMMHGVIGRNEGFPIKSVGWFVMLILPGAFVEPEGEEMMPEKGKDEENEEEADDDDEVHNPWGEGSFMSKLRVLAAGSWSNITVALLVLLAMFAVTTSAHGTRDIRGVYDYQGVEIFDVANRSPARAAGFEKGMIVTNIDGHPVSDLNDFQTATNDFEINQTVWLSGTANNSRFNISATLGVRPRATNFTYEPAPIDPLLVRMEQSIPGTIDFYDSWNDWIVDESDTTRMYRWQWIRDNYDGLDETAEAHIQQINGSINRNEEPYLGITVVPEREVKAGFGFAEEALSLLLTLFYFMVIIHAGVGAANLLPVKPLDGGWIFAELVEKYKSAWTEPLTKWVSITTIALFVANLMVPFLL